MDEEDEDEDGEGMFSQKLLYEYVYISDAILLVHVFCFSKCTLFWL